MSDQLSKTECLGNIVKQLDSFWRNEDVDVYESGKIHAAMAILIWLGKEWGCEFKQGEGVAGDISKGLTATLTVSNKSTVDLPLEGGATKAEIDAGRVAAAVAASVVTVPRTLFGAHVSAPAPWTIGRYLPLSRTFDPFWQYVGPAGKPPVVFDAGLLALMRGMDVLPTSELSCVKAVPKETAKQEQAEGKEGGR